jgi:hypothetical protein
MTEAINNIPAETRWEIATKGLTGAIVAMEKAIKDAMGQNKYDEFSKALWYEAGKGAKDFADNIGLATENAKDIEEVLKLLGLTAMGPEFNFEVVEATEDKCVGRTNLCAWHERWKELGIDFDICNSGHQSWGEGAVENLNSNFTFSLTKNMVCGDSYCEWVIERKK